MARRYARDNRGRFASKGTGATARGGRLKTAGGSKRQTQTMQSSAAPRAGAIRGKVKRDPTAASRVGQTAAAKPKARTSGASFERRRALAAPEAAATRRFNAEAARPMQISGKKPGSKADQSFRDKVGQASYNRQRTAEGVARRAKRFHDAASQMHSAFSQRPRYSTISNPAKDIGMWSSSRQSAWVNDLGKRRRR